MVAGKDVKGEDVDVDRDCKGAFAGKEAGVASLMDEEARRRVKRPI